MRIVTPACVTAIPLGRRLPGASSNQPGRPDPDIDPGATRLKREAPRRPYSVLLPVGFAVPPALPPARCALTAPFHPCCAPSHSRPRKRGRLGWGTAVCFLWHFPWARARRTLSGTACPWSPDFPLRAPSHPSPQAGEVSGAGAAVRPTDSDRDGGRGARRQEASRSNALARAAILRGRPRWASRSCSVRHVEASARPSTRCGRKWRWNAATTSCVAES